MHPTIRTVLVTGAGGPAGTSAVHQLLDRGMRVIATDITPLAFPAEDFLLGPRAESPSYIPFLEETVARLGVDLLVPTVQEELPALAAAAPILGCRVAIAAAGPVLLCHDKLLTMRFLAACGIPVPSTATVRPSGVSPQRVRERPFVVKPRLSRGSRGAVVLDSSAQVPARDDTFIAQELAPGEEFRPQVHRSAVDGAATAVVLRKPGPGHGRIGDREGIQRLDAGMEPQISRIALDVARSLELDGAIDMDVRRTREGHPVVLEVSARLGKNSHHCPELLDGILDDAVGARAPVRRPVAAIPDGAA